MNFAPPECVNPKANFYTKLALMTSLPFVAPPLIYSYLHLIAHDPDAKHKTLAWSIMFFVFLINSVTTVLFRTFDCTRFDGGEHYLTAQLNLSCKRPRTNGGKPTRSS